MSEHIEGGFTGAAGGRIYWQGWVPDSASGVVVISHGLAEHGGRYAHVAQWLASVGYPTYAHDHRGHGKSEGPRANIDRMAGVVADLDTMIGTARERHPGVPVFLLGHSMGGLIALQYVTGTPAELAGVVLSAPAVEVAIGSKVQRVSAGLLSRVLPNLGVLKLDSAMVSRDPDVVHAYDTDPLNYRGKIRVRTGAEMLHAAEAMPARLANLKLPVLLLQGSADQLVAPVSAHVVADGAGSEDLTLKSYDGLYHEVMNEPEKDTVLADLVEWLQAHS